MSYTEYESLSKLGEQLAEQQKRENFIKNLENMDEIAAALKREQFKTRVNNETVTENTNTDTNTISKNENEKYGWENPEVAARPIGKWQAIETK